ncbi:BTB/POZ domain-containing protein 17-like [Ptychodera flava]|uniref:BTB/POZ domain-containing protein 17-like n=1 Tax=Ptychodera flava TaxID=63121 RepID=UPI00396A0513
MVQRLSKLCIDYMCNELNCDNVIGWDKYATKFTLTRLSEECFTFMQQNIDLLIDSKKFLNMNIDQFVKVLQSSYVHIPDEYTLFKSVKDWAFAYDRSCSSDDIKSNLGIMLPHIRYPMMTGEQLDTIEKDEAINACYPEMKDEINSSYKFHATAITNPNWSLRKVTPRHYYHGYSCKFTLPNYSRRHHDNNRYVKVFPIPRTVRLGHSPGIGLCLSPWVQDGQTWSQQQRADLGSVQSGTRTGREISPA